jgi:hypothetical protein
MKKAILIICMILIPFELDASEFWPTGLYISAPAGIRYEEGTKLKIPFTLNGTSAAVWLVVTTHSSVFDIKNIKNGYLGWHYVNNIDTTIYISPRYEKNVGGNEILWDDASQYLDPLNYALCSYYLFGYDDKSSRQPVCDFIQIAHGRDSQYVDIIQKGTDGFPLAHPIIFGCQAAWARSLSNINLPLGTQFKWIIGSDPHDPGNLQTTFCEGFEDSSLYLYGGPVLNPSDYNIFYQCATDIKHFQTTFLKWQFVNNGTAILDKNWLGWNNLTLQSAVHKNNIIPSNYTDGKYIYSLDSAPYEQKEWNKLRCVTDRKSVV